MSAVNALDARVDELGKTSRRAALISLCGFVLVLLAIGFAVVALHSLELQRKSLRRENQTLMDDISKTRQELTGVRADLAKSRASLASARAAINAFHSGRLQDAVALYDEALTADPDNAYLQNLRAYCLFRLGRVDEAIAGQRKSLSIDPGYAWGYFDLARFLYAAKPPKTEEARKAELKAIELRPDMRSIIKSDGEFQKVRR
jgi:tetratricopeptide (TPR) repeat protein